MNWINWIKLLGVKSQAQIEGLKRRRIQGQSEQDGMLQKQRVLWRKLSARLREGQKEIDRHRSFYRTCHNPKTSGS